MREKLVPVVILSVCMSSGCGPFSEPVVEPASESPWVVLQGHTVDHRVLHFRIRPGHPLEAVDPEAIPEGSDVLHGEVITPGLVDAHAHAAGVGRLAAELDLVGLTSYAAVLDAVAAAAGDGEGWLLGRGWDQNDWPDAPEGTWPRAADLEARAPGRKVALRRVDGHAMWISPAVAAELGETVPEGGRVLRDPDGGAAILVDAAMELVQVPAPAAPVRRERLRAGLERMASAGLVGVHDMGVGDDGWSDYQALADALPIRAWVYASQDTLLAERVCTTGPELGERLSLVGVKLYADGALGSRGAHLSAPYADEPGHTGLVINSPETLTALTTRCLGAGAQVAVHAIGDQAVTDVLDAFAAARAAHPERADVPLRVEHAQVVRPEDRARFAALGVVASMQPTHATSDMPWAEERLGETRTHWAYSWKSLSEQGALLAFGSDAPVESCDPGLGLWSATMRTDLDGRPEGGWLPEERIELEAAVRGFSDGAHRAVGQEPRLLVTGAPADVSLFRRTGAGRLRAVATVVDGTVVWRDRHAMDVH